MFQAVYESPLVHPVVAWVAGALFVVAIASRMPFLAGYLVVFTLAILADATLTGPWSPVLSVKALAAAVPVAFVVLGDARWFVLVLRVRRRKLDARALFTAFALALVVPFASSLLGLAWPSAFAEARHVYLAYEAMFVALAAAARVWLPRALAAAPPDERRWALRATSFEIVQYALWALADVVILAGHDAGFALRLAPNAMYYVLFLPYVAWTAPRAIGEPWARADA